jgi:polar amino acid transport system substrate-binding protein
MRKVTVSLMAAILLVGLAACGSDNGTKTTGGAAGLALVNADTLTVATNLPAPGFWNGDDPSSITGGYEYGIAKEIARRLGLPKGVKVENVSFDALVAGQAKGFDIALSQVTITEDRAKVVDFSVPYFASDQGVLVNKGTSVPDLAAAKALQWGVQQSTTGQTFLDTVVKPTKETRVYGETTQAFTALQARQIDAVLLDTAIVLGQAAQPGSPFAVVGQFASGEAYGAVLAKGSSIRDAIDEQITAMRNDGTLDRLSAEFLTPQYGADPTKVPYIKVT